MEPRPSMLTVVKNGLLSSGRTTYIHRMLYVGEHKLGRSGLDELMKNVLSAQADQTREEGLSGFLLVYHSHFIHLVEGSESTLTKHLRGVVDSARDRDEAPPIGRVKVIFEIAHINKRCINSWSSRAATPPSLASPIKPGLPPAEMARHADAVLGKTLRLIDAVKKLPPGAALSQQMTLQLPEPELLQALLASPLFKDARDILAEQRVPPRITLYDDVVWPMQSDFVPYNLLEEPIEAPHGDGGQAGPPAAPEDDDEEGPATKDGEAEKGEEEEEGEGGDAREG